jgi:hypothetical protein
VELVVEVENLYLDLYLSLIPLVEHAGSNQLVGVVREKKIAVKVVLAEHMGGWNAEVMVVDPKLYVSSCP